MKVSAVFCDYDGTLAPDNVPRELSRLPESVLGALIPISRSVPLAVVTSKDCSFTIGRVPFASGWACVCGAEAHTSDGWKYVARATGEIAGFLESLRPCLGEGVVVEEKRGCGGKLLGFSVDLRHARTTRAVDDLVALAPGGVFTVMLPGSTYVDFFASRPDKGAAVKRLRRRLGIDRGLLYMGDTAADNGAFREADISVLVEHGQQKEGIDAEYSVPFREVGSFLRSLLRSDMEFHAGSALLSKKGGAV